VDLLQRGSQGSAPALRDYLETLADNLEALRLDEKSPQPFDQAVVDSIEAFLPYRDEFVHVVSALARHEPTELGITALKRFFERALVYCFPLPTMNQYSTDWFDNYKFIVHELFLYAVAILLKYECFASLDALMAGGFYVGSLREFTHQPMQGFDILRDRAKLANINFSDLMQADFVLFIRDAFDSLRGGKENRWYPEVLIFLGHGDRVFEIFARAKSTQYFEKIKAVIGIRNASELPDFLREFGKSLYVPRFNYLSFNPSALMNADQIASVP
jgi:hypothetical protein